MSAPLDDSLKRDLIGARRKIIFVEGTEKSIDKSLYSLVFPMVSIIPKGNRYSVEQAVAGARVSESLHWLQVFGIVDSDGLSDEKILSKRERGIYAVPFYSVEALYFHPRIVERIAERQAAVTGEDGAKLAAAAIGGAVGAIKDHTARLSKKAAKKAIRDAVLAQIPNDDELLSSVDIRIVTEADTLHSLRTRKLDEAVAIGNWETILTMCPVRESSALESISSVLGFRNRAQYQKAVRHLVTEDPAQLTFIRELFGTLYEEILK